MQNVLIQEGKEMASVLYTYRSCVKALPQVSFGFSLNRTFLDIKYILGHSSHCYTYTHSAQHSTETEHVSR
jgi:hypothetical protein